MKQNIFLFFFTVFFSTSINAQEAIDLQLISPTGPHENDGEIIATVTNDGNGSNAMHNFTWSVFSINPTGEVEILSEDHQKNSILSNLATGTYGLTVTNEEGCQAISSIYLEICTDCLTAKYAYSLTSDACALQFTDLSSGDPIDWQWEFGDGAISDEQHPTHTYNKSGCYEVLLTAWDNNGAISTYAQQICISGCDDDYEDHGNFNVQLSGPASAYLNQSYDYTSQVSGGVAPYDYWWQLYDVNPDGSRGDQSNDCGTVSSNGTAATPIRFPNQDCPYPTHKQKILELMVTDAYGNISNAEMQIAILGTAPSCVMDIAGNKTPGGLVNMRILGSLLGSDCYDVYPYWRWNYGDGSAEEELFWITEHIYPTASTYEIKAVGCTEPFGEGSCVTVLGQADIIAPVPPGTPTYFDIAPTDIIQAEAGQYLPEPLKVKVHNLPQNVVDFLTIEIAHYEVEWRLLDNATKEVLDLSPRLGPYTGAELMDENLDKGDYNFPLTADMWGCLDVELRVYPFGYYKGKLDFDGNGSYDEGPDDLCQTLGIPNRCVGWIGGTTPADLSKKYTLEEWNVTSSTVGVETEAWAGEDVSTYSENFPFTVKEECKIEVAYIPLEVHNIQINTDCEPTLEVLAEKGAQKPTSGSCGTQHYKTYTWIAYDIRNPSQAIEGLLLGGNSPCVSIDRSHPYLAQFEGDGLSLFMVEVAVEDYFGVTESTSKLVSLAPPLRVDIPDQITRCPGTVSAISHAPLATGGDGYHTYHWPAAIGLIEDPTNPRLRLIDLSTLSNFDFTITVTDGTGCSISKTIQVNSDPLLTEAGPDWIRICQTGPSAHLLGPENPDDIASGGSGSYTYEWQPAAFIYGPNDVPNPIPIADGSNWVDYTLVTTDEFGCTAQDVIRVVPTTPPVGVPIADAGTNQTICHGTPTVIGNNGSTNGYEFIWTSDHPTFGTSQVANPVLSEVHNEQSGTFTYSLQAIHSNSGCYDEDVMQVTVRDQWVYQGYEARVLWPDDGRIDLWASPINKIYTSTEPGFNSGATAPLYYQWLPDENGLYNVGYDNQGIPNDGEFTPDPTEPYKQLIVSDANGCTRTFKTNKGLPSSENPYLEISLIDVGGNPTFPVICGPTTGDACFKLELFTYVDTDFPQYLPATLRVNYSWKKNVSPSGSQLVDNGTIDLRLVDGATGKYEAIQCLGPLDYTDATNEVSRFSVSGDLNQGGYVSENWFYAQYDFFVSSTQPIQQIAYVCDDDGDDNIYTPSARLIVAGTDVGCSQLLIPNEVSAQLVAASDRGTVIINPLTQAVDQSHFHAFVSECFTLSEEENTPPKEELSLTLKEEQIAQPQNLLDTPIDFSRENLTSDFTIVPNPFSDYLQIKYFIAGWADEQLTIRILGVAGEVKTTLLSNQAQSAGFHTIDYDASQLAPGTYFIEMQIAGKEHLVKRMVKMATY